MDSNQTPDSFIARYIPLVLDSIHNNHRDNYDTHRFGPEINQTPNHESAIRRAARQALANVGLTTSGAASMMAAQGWNLANRALRRYLPHLSEIEWLHSRFSDEESREILCKVLAYRALGYRKIKLPLNTPRYWKELQSMIDSVSQAESFDLGFMGFRAYKMDLHSCGYPIELFFNPVGAYIQFVLEPYKCQTPSGTVEVKEGDVVLDCGGCYGDTAMYFAHLAGSSGRVYSFEFVPSNLELWQRNVDMNPHLKQRIQLVKAPVWSESGKPLFIEGSGPGSRVVAETKASDALEVKTISIDDMVREQKLDTVNFIKMDIEGAELAALRGAVTAIRRFRPKLAISVYHNLEDFWTIPQFLSSLEIGYRFYLRHFTIHAEETVLFAVPE